MRSFVLLVFAVAGLWGASAHAQFANRSLGVSLGYMSINADPTLDFAFPLTLESSLYIENGFETTLRVPLMILAEKISGRQLIAAGGNLGIRYLFSEEQLRPYLGADLVYLHIFRESSATTNLFGVGPHAGIDYFAGESVAIGARAFVSLFLALNTQVTSALGAQAVVSTYF